ANGASYKVAPETFWELGANVIVIGNQPNGKNINFNCGSTNTDNLKAKVIKENADIGIALDGDADRIVIIDEKGDEIDGNLLFALIVKNMKEKELLNNKSIISTIMANMALEKYLSEINLDLIRTSVGDRYLVEGMRENNSNIGGEPSGHIVMSNFGKTGDGLIAALQILSIMCFDQRPISEIVNLFKLYPQKNITIPINGEDPLTDTNVQNVIKEQENILGSSGRIIVRKSGTEPIVRIMVECLEAELANKTANQISDSIKSLINKKN
ncbi:MAG: phosphoglucosamine mutase, partial [Hyphomicrobiales bacterium]|nr:phosphoglucosamine mutase [Hyphomicrobiales bacterium]